MAPVLAMADLLPATLRGAPMTAEMPITTTGAPMISGALVPATVLQTKTTPATVLPGADNHPGLLITVVLLATTGLLPAEILALLTGSLPEE